MGNGRKPITLTKPGIKEYPKGRLTPTKNFLKKFGQKLPNFKITFLN